MKKIKTVEKTMIEIINIPEYTNAEDKIFLLSRSEVENTKYFKDNFARQAMYTGYTENVYKCPCEEYDWWLRASDVDGNEVYYVDSYGDVYDAELFKEILYRKDFRGVRPACWIKL